MLSRRDCLISAAVGLAIASASRARAQEYRAGAREGRLDILNLLELEQEAAKVIPRPAFDYIARGAGDEWTLSENRRAFEDFRILPRVLTRKGDPVLRTALFGQELASPIIVPPMAAHGLAHVSAEIGSSQGAADAGMLYTICVNSNAAMEEIAAQSQGPRWFQLYFAKDPGLNRDLLSRAKTIGCSAIVLTVSQNRAGNRESDIRNRFSYPPALTFGNLGRPMAPWADYKPDLGWGDLDFVQKESGLPVVVKGVLSPEDARLCAERGAAVQVSNHGGRQLDGVPAAITMLPRIVEAVGGRAPVLMDGGVRRGIDVFKALALGASAVAIGRPVLYGLALGGREGVRSVLDHINGELALTMALAGCAAIGEIRRDFLL